MNIIKSIKNAALAAVMYATLATGCATKPVEFEALGAAPQPVVEQVEEKQPSRIKLGYNALEIAATDEGDVRTRLLTNIDFLVGPVEIGYHPLNEMDNLDTDTYFGNHRFTLGHKDIGTKLEVRVKANSHGATDEKIGVRDYSLVEATGGYGYLESTANKDGANITLFYGRNLGKGFSAEFLQVVDVPFDNGKKTNYYNELQLNMSLGKHFALFGRIEMPGFDVDKNRYLVGGTFKF